MKLSLLLLCVLPLTAQALSGVVTKVSDGDTVWVQPDDADRPVKLRLQGIDAPESCQAWGEQATAALAAKVLNQRVDIVNARDHDDYGRLLGTLTFKGQDMGAWMVTQGHAWSYRYRRSLGPYIAQETQARVQGRGLFSQAGFDEPRWFRKSHGPCH
jgi:micrococcal nuclease